MRASNTSAANLLRLLSAMVVLLAVPVVLYLARPLMLRISVRDDVGRPVEAVVVRVGRVAEPRQAVELYTDPDGNVATEIAGLAKTLDVTVNPAPAASSAASETGRGPTYETEREEALPSDRYDDEALSFALEARLPTRQICRLTGYDTRSGPYRYAGQDSAITIPYVRAENGRTVEHVLWWFGDTVGTSDGPILVPNKMALSDPAADASHCIELRYLGARDRAPLAVDANVPDEATVWIDVPLVSSSVPDTRPHGAFAYRPDLGDRLHLAYLSVADTKPLFTVTHLGLATSAPCGADCAVVGEGAGIRLEREPQTIWKAPLEYTRAPEGNAFLFDDVYTILKVAERRTYCSMPPHATDCSSTRPCADGSECVAPGKFCDQAPHVACRDDAACEKGRCVPGGVVAMQVPRTAAADKSAYRYWNARSRSFDPLAAREPDAIYVDPHLGNSVSIMWSDYARRWIMLSNYESGVYTGQRLVALRSAEELLGPWSEPETIMENLGGQRSYNPRFVPMYTRSERPSLVYWTATYDAYDSSWPMHGKPFDYNVFLYETDLAATSQIARSRTDKSLGTGDSLARSASHENVATSSRGETAIARSSNPSEAAR